MTRLQPGHNAHAAALRRYGLGCSMSEHVPINPTISLERSA